MDIMDIHGRFWICMDMDMVDIQMDIQKWISILDIHVYFGYPTWISILDMYGCGYGGYPKGPVEKDIQNTYLYWISMSIMVIQHGYHVWISIISMKSRGLN